MPQCAFMNGALAVSPNYGLNSIIMLSPTNFKKYFILLLFPWNDDDKRIRR